MGQNRQTGSKKTALIAGLCVAAVVVFAGGFFYGWNKAASYGKKNAPKQELALEKEEAATTSAEDAAKAQKKDDRENRRAYDAAKDLLEKGRFKEAKEAFDALGKYNDSEDQAKNAQMFAEQVEKVEANADLMEHMIELFEAEDWKALGEEYRSDRYMELRKLTPKTGIPYGDKVLIFHEFFYYGDIVDGKAQGNGKGLTADEYTSSWNYSIYIGEWDDNAPHGSGHEYHETLGNNFSWGTKVTGTYDHWYQEGDMVMTDESGGKEQTFRYTVVNHIPETVDTVSGYNGEPTPVTAYAEDDHKRYFSSRGNPLTALRIFPEGASGQMNSWLFSTIR